MAENQRQPDRGDGRFVNPILGGDFPDPSVVRVGGDYYLTNSSFNYAPGLLVWHSRDLVNWEPVGHALSEHDGDIWAPDICHHDGAFVIYYPTSGTNHAVTAPDPAGPWTRPVDLGVGGIDPGHVVGPDGTRALHLSSGMAAELAPDGLALISKPKEVYKGWPIPDDWTTEGFCLEGPKLFRRGDHYYLLSAQGGTAGPATSHMVVAAQSDHPMGPWENSPHNPVIHTASRDERWWSVGHGTILETTAGEWWMMLHGYEKGFHTLGRQTLLVPIAWTDDGWPVVPADFDAAKPYRKPAGGERVPHGMALSDDFAGPELGPQWRWWLGPEDGRCAVGDGALRINAKGAGPQDCRPLACIPVDHAYEVEVDAEIEGDGQAGLCLFYNPACFIGLGLAAGHVDFLHHAGGFGLVDGGFRRARLRLRNDRHELTYAVRPEGENWQRIASGREVSGYHHNVFGGFLSLRVALTASGSGRAVFRDFRYRAL